MKRFLTLLGCVLMVLSATPAVTLRAADPAAVPADQGHNNGGDQSAPAAEDQGSQSASDEAGASAAEQPDDTASSATSSQQDEAVRQHQLAATAAAAAVATKNVPRTPDFLEHLVDEVLDLFDVPSSGNTPVHYGIAALFLVCGFLLRRVITGIVFRWLRKLASKTTTTLDDKLFPALEGPVATFVALVGIFAALKVLKLSVSTDHFIHYGSTVAFSLVIFWALLRAFNALLDHAQEVARARQMGIAAFMPWIKKTLVTLFVVLGLLLVIQSLGYDVKALLAGLGIGGLAFALAAQDTLANLFGSVVVAIDQPFRLGEFVKIGSFLGGVEDIGLRSTKLRALDKSLVTIPNKTVASETITNLSRFTQRRCEQVIGLTYDTPPEQMAEVVEEFRGLILKEDYIDPTSVLVYFRDFSASSLDIWIVYVTKDGDFMKHMELRQKLNMAFMRVVQRRGLSFAFPSQTIYFDGDIARKLAERSKPAGPVPGV
jgi:MscS family membrane protein